MFTSGDSLMFKPALGLGSQGRWADIANQVLSYGGTQSTSQNIANLKTRESILQRLKQNQIRANRSLS